MVKKKLDLSHPTHNNWLEWSDRKALAVGLATIVTFTVSAFTAANWPWVATTVTGFQEPLAHQFCQWLHCDGFSKPKN